MAQCQLRNRLGGSARGVHDLDAVLFGILDVDVVHADTAADDELQLGALRLVDVVCADLRALERTTTASKSRRAAPS